MKKLVKVMLAIMLFSALATTFFACIGEDNSELEYTITKDGKAYSVNKVSKTAENISIRKQYKGLPVTEIAEGVFSGCEKLTGITIPQTITVIGKDAFSWCPSLTSVYYNGSLADWCNIKFSSCESNPLSRAHNLYINNELVREIEIPNTVTAIGDYQFYGWNGMKVKLHANMKSIGDYAFAGNNKLLEVYNRSNLNITKGSEDNGYVGYFALGIYKDECDSKLSTEKNGYMIYADGDNKILVGYTGQETELVLPEDIVEINQSAFFSNWNITTITIPVSVIKLGEFAFTDCYNLKSVYYNGSIADWCNIRFGKYDTNPLYYAHNLYINNELVREIEIPDTVTTIGNHQFSGWNGTKITIGENVTSLGDYAFSNCNGLTSITIPKSVTSIGSCAFSGRNMSEIYYDETMSEWNAITKSENWDGGIIYYKIHCSDGKIFKSYD